MTNLEKIGTYTTDFITSLPTTGAAADADSLPTCAIFAEYDDGTPTLTPTVVKRTGRAGSYKVTYDVGSMSTNCSYSVIISATVGGIAAKAVIAAFKTSDTMAAINNKLIALPPDPADASDIAASFAIVNTKLDTIDDFVDTEIGAIKAKTDQLTFTGGKVDANAALSMTPTDLNSIADALLKRDWNSVTGEAAYSALNAFRMLRNVWNTTGGTLSVKKEDGTTNAWTRTLSVDPTAQPITGAT